MLTSGLENRRQDERSTRELLYHTQEKSRIFGNVRGTFEKPDSERQYGLAASKKQVFNEKEPKLLKEAQKNETGE